LLFSLHTLISTSLETGSSGRPDAPLIYET
jgi:hypothetical protein